MLSAREGLDSGNTRSDSAPLADLVRQMLAAAGSAIHVIRDPTRGGVATTVKEIALQSAVDITLDESAIPIAAATRGFCAILGLDPLFVANEGKLLCFVAPEQADGLLEVIRSHPLGRDAAIIGRVDGPGAGKVRMRTSIGGLRAVDMLSGEQLPRIC